MGLFVVNQLLKQESVAMIVDEIAYQPDARRRTPVEGGSQPKKQLKSQKFFTNICRRAFGNCVTHWTNNVTSRHTHAVVNNCHNA
jgi:hypothetical protein